MCKHSIYNSFYPDYPKVMGILNVTPDSFYDGGKFEEKESLINRIHQMINEEVDIIDVGGMSSKPGAEIIPEQEEIERIEKAIKQIRELSKTVSISIDTMRVKVAERAILAGANVINDISGGEYDPDMFSFVASTNIPFCLMHMKGTPATMQQMTNYTDLVGEVTQHFEQKIELLEKKGFNKVILDPGFGFSKTLDQNYELLASLKKFKTLGKPILVGVSRKSMIYNYLNITPKEALNASTVLHTFALANGASILRVHDVKEAVEAVKIYQKIKSSN